MNITSWSPYIPIYPNVQIPETKQSSRRVVEPSTRADVMMTSKEDWPTRVEKLREAHRSIAIISYGSDGKRKIPSIETGQVFNFYR